MGSKGNRGRPAAVRILTKLTQACGPSTVVVLKVLGRWSIMSLLLLQEVALSEHEARSYGAAAFKKGYHAYFSGCERTSRRGHGGAMILAKASLKSASAWAVKDRGGAAGKRCVGDLSVPCAGLQRKTPSLTPSPAWEASFSTPTAPLDGTAKGALTTICQHAIVAVSYPREEDCRP